MCKKKNNKQNSSQLNIDFESVYFGNFDGSVLDTLAQLRSPQNQRVTQKKDLIKKARAKFMTRGLVIALAGLKGDLTKSYWNTYHCNSILHQVGKKLSSLYCNNRWCAVCNRVRTAKLINGYLPQIKQMKEKYFVTLTIPNVPESQLSFFINDMTKVFAYITDHCFRRIEKQKFVGLRKLECTYNEERNDYHPHFHVLCFSEYQAQTLVDYWLQFYSDAVSIAQDIRPANDDSVMELFKYFTKTAVKDKKTNKISVNAKMLDVIFRAMVGRRVFQNYGGFKKVSEDIDDIYAVEVTDLVYKNDLWIWDDCDWINNSNEKLTEYDPNESFRELVKSISKR